MSYAIVFLAGRVIFCAFHLLSGANHFRSLNAYTQHAASKGVPAAKLAIIGSGVLLFIGGLSILLGFHARIGIAALLLFYAGVTPVMHNFWAAAPEQKMSEMINFMKNLTIFGALLMFLMIPRPWPFSV